MEIQIPIHRMRWLVLENGSPLRAFHTQSEAIRFIGNDGELSLYEIPTAYKTIQVEEAPF